MQGIDVAEHADGKRGLGCVTIVVGREAQQAITSPQGVFDRLNGTSKAPNASTYKTELRLSLPGNLALRLATAIAMLAARPA